MWCHVNNVHVTLFALPQGRAKGAVGQLQPGGDRPDLLIWGPNDEEPTIVEFESRIREARRNTVSSPHGIPDLWKWSEFTELESDDLSGNFAADLGFVVFLLSRSDHDTILKVRDLLQAKEG